MLRVDRPPVPHLPQQTASKANARRARTYTVLLYFSLPLAVGAIWVDNPYDETDFAEKLAAPFDLFVNDAFGTAHRAHGSTEGVTKFLSPSVAGFLLQKELDYLEGAVKEPKRPFAAIVGGSKVSSKIGEHPDISRLLLLLLVLCTLCDDIVSAASGVNTPIRGVVHSCWVVSSPDTHLLL